MGENSGRRVVVTGMGVVNPLGGDVAAFWAALVAGRSAIGPITRFDPAGLPVTLGAEVTGFVAAEHVPRRLVVKSDRFAHYALAAAGEALADARLDLTTLDPFRVGISFGNNSGGWDLCERGFVEYYGQGPTMVNPWQATAWFPTAPQGFVSIRHGIRGPSKSFAADRASGACGVLFGERSVRWGRADVVLVGGSEAPLTRLGVAAHVTTGELSRSTDPASAYRPFGAGRDGLVLGEGAAVLVLEELGHALARGATVHGEVLSVEQRSGEAGEGGDAERAMTAALRRARLAAAEVDLVLAEGCGTVDGDRAEAAALARVFAGAPGVPVSVPKAGYGHLYGASFATELVCGLRALRAGLLPPTPGAAGPAEDCPAVTPVAASRPARIDRLLVAARSREGTAVALVAGGPPA